MSNEKEASAELKTLLAELASAKARIAELEAAVGIPCITRIGKGMDDLAFVVYLRDGKKITVGRDGRTSGPAWLKVEDQLRIGTAETTAPGQPPVNERRFIEP